MPECVLWNRVRFYLKWEVRWMKPLYERYSRRLPLILEFLWNWFMRILPLLPVPVESRLGLDKSESYTDLPCSMILARAELARSSKTAGMAGTSLSHEVPAPTLGLLNRWHCWIHKEGTTIQWMDATRFDSSRDSYGIRHLWLAI